MDIYKLNGPSDFVAKIISEIKKELIIPHYFEDVEITIAALDMINAISESTVVVGSLIELDPNKLKSIESFCLKLVETRESEKNLDFTDYKKHIIESFSKLAFLLKGNEHG